MNEIKEVWEDIKSGKESSLTEIFNLYYVDLYQYGIKIFNLPDLVKDSIQDVFVRVWERRNSIGRIQNPKAYLISSLRRKLFLNKQVRFAELSDDLLKKEKSLVFSFSSSEFIEVKELSAQLKNTLVDGVNSLPEKQRELIFLRFYYNLRYKEIGEIMETKEQTVRNLMQRTIANLRSKIDKQLWEEIDNVDDIMMTLFCFFQKNR